MALALGFVMWLFGRRRGSVEDWGEFEYFLL